MKKNTEIRCPYCNSNQLTLLSSEENEKNTVVILCLACGKEFCPGEGNVVELYESSQADIAGNFSSIPSLHEINKKIIKFCSVGSHLEAVKYYKDTMGCSLKTAKEYVYTLAAKHGVAKQKGCFIATACYGNFDAQEVLILRRFRDHTLMKTLHGKTLVYVYYLVSPFLANVISHSFFLKKIVLRFLLKPLVKKLNR